MHFHLPNVPFFPPLYFYLHIHGMLGIFKLDYFAGHSIAAFFSFNITHAFP